jgi:uncharacterized protein YrrD
LATGTKQEVSVHRVSNIIGKTIVSAQTGNRLGSVSDALLDDGAADRVNVVGLVIGGGPLGRERVLPFQEIQTLGGDAVLARTDASARSAKEWHRSGVEAMRSSALRGKPVVTTAGQRLGQVSDLLVDDETGAFDGVEVAAQSLPGLLRKRTILRATRGIRLGPDAVVVPDDSVDGADNHHLADQPGEDSLAGEHYTRTREP